jgi:ATP-dependent helicase HrpA
MGITHVDEFPFVDAPKKNALDDAISELQKLGALNDYENLTEVGEFMSDIPLEPKLGRMIAEAARMEKTS